MSDEPEVAVHAPIAQDGLVCLPLDGGDEVVLVPMTPSIADQLADQLRDAAAAARKQRPDRVT